MKAITLHRPWSDGIAYGGKDIENRGWKPWKSIIGEHIGIHAGRRFEPLEQDDMPEGFVVPGPTESPQGIVAIARVRGWIRRVRGGHIEHDGELSRELAERAAESPWWSPDAVGWLIDNVVAIPPVACRGSQGLWRVPDDIRRRCRFRYRAVSAGMLDPRPAYLRIRERADELVALSPTERAQRACLAGIRLTAPTNIAVAEVAREMEDEARRLEEHERAA